MQKNRIRANRQGLAFKTLLTIIMLLYPGLGTRIFNIFRCKEIDGLPDQHWFQDDLTMACYVPNSKHDNYLQVALVSVIVIVIGTPFSIGMLLFYNRKDLHDEESTNHLDLQYRLGDLYRQYEDNFW
jgi:hypothetical protein